ncbi:MAG: hypothetical protein KatS3mg089_0829 [Patescibacteria group bacterium]|nr:MAG: hypothetical protein KatS3mg089_0829 [Patescibacteria group bacterium]
MKKNKHILLVRSGYPSKEFILKKLKEFKYYVIVLDTKKSCPDYLVDEWILTNSLDNTQAIEAIKQYLRKANKKIDGVITFWEEAVIATAAIAQELSLPGIDPRKAEEIKNKYTFRSFCKMNNFNTPFFSFLTEKDVIDEKIKNKLPFPLVVKPIYGAASAFVMKVDSWEELRNAFFIIKKYIKSFWLANEWKNFDLFIEQYIDGQEVDIDLLIQEGEIKFWSITDNFQTHEPFFVETGQAIPTNLSHNKQQQLIEMASNILRTAKIRNGCIHFEAKYSSCGPIPIEINLRMGGDEVYSFIKNAWGVDLIENAVKISLGEKIEVKKPNKPLMYLEGRYFLPHCEGKISKIFIDPTLIKDPSLFELKIVKKMGDNIFLPPKDYDYFGWITTKGRTAEKAHEALLRLYPKVQFSVKEYEQNQFQMYF